MIKICNTLQYISKYVYLIFEIESRLNINLDVNIRYMKFKKFFNYSELYNL